MAWYHDTGRTSYVATYNNHKQMSKEVVQASKHGWMPSNPTTTPGRYNLGVLLLAATFTFGISLFFGVGRSKDIITVTYTRK